MKGAQREAGPGGWRGPCEGGGNWRIGGFPDGGGPLEGRRRGHAEDGDPKAWRVSWMVESLAWREESP